MSGTMTQFLIRSALAFVAVLSGFGCHRIDEKVVASFRMPAAPPIRQVLTFNVQGPIPENIIFVLRLKSSFASWDAAMRAYAGVAMRVELIDPMGVSHVYQLK